MNKPKDSTNEVEKQVIVSFFYCMFQLLKMYFMSSFIFQVSDIWPVAISMTVMKFTLC